jgi:hypothetical protein
MIARAAAVALLGVVAAVGCGDDTVCGPGEAATDGLVVTGGEAALTFGEATSSPNNDCPVEGAPTSLTVEIRQLDPAPSAARFLVLCLPRPDQIGSDPIDITDDRIQVIDVFADDGDCLISLDRTRELAGTLSFTGFCDDGVAPAGYALGFAATVPATRACPGAPAEPIELELGGELAVTALSI